MRSLVTGLVMLVDLLKSHDTRVLAAACAVIGILAKEPENLAILTDYDIVQRLSSLVHTVIHIIIKYYMCSAIEVDCGINLNFSFCRAIRTSKPICLVPSVLAVYQNATVTRSVDLMQYCPFPNTYIPILIWSNRTLPLLYTVCPETRQIVWPWNLVVSFPYDE